MTTFEEIYQFTHQWEGGKVVDPGDPGGATAYGVSFRFLKEMPLDLADINRDGVVTWQDVMAMGEDDAELIFFRYFWAIPGIKNLPVSIRGVVFDTAVNVGRKRAIKWLQYIVKAEPDGVIGEQTKSMAFHATGEILNGANCINAAILARRRAHYGDLAARREWARKYYQGWINRTAALEEMILGEQWVGGKR